MREMALGELDLGVGAARRVDVAYQRQDRMVVRRESKLGLPAVGELAVFRDHAPDALELCLEEDPLVLLVEVPVFALELGEAPVVLDPDGIAPRQVEPHLEVADIGGRVLRVGRARGQLQVSRRLLDAQCPRRLTHPAKDEVALLGREITRSALAQVEEEIDRLLLAVVLDLGQQRWNEVEGRPHVGVAVEQRRHLVIVLGRAQPHPRQEVSAREVVLVVRLVHVPDEGNVEWLHFLKRSGEV